MTGLNALTVELIPLDYPTSEDSETGGVSGKGLVPDLVQVFEKTIEGEADELGD